MTIEYRNLGPGDRSVLQRCLADVFDEEINLDWTTEFLNDPRHHIVVALSSGIVVGFASAVHYLHPDKQPQMFINEIGVAPDFRRQGIARTLLNTIIEQGRELGCSEAWVLTDRSNRAAMRLYQSCDAEDPEDTVMFTFVLD